MKKRLLNTITLSILLIFGGKIAAQNLLTVEDAIAIALKNNYNILIAANASQVAEINNNIGNAGMLPNVTLNASRNASNSAINQKYTNGLEVQRSGVGSNTLNANIALDWVLFDGMRMFIAKDILEQLQLQSNYTLKDQVQQTVAQVVNTYYGLVGQKMQIKATQKTLEFVNQRYDIINAKYTVGLLSAFDVNQVKIEQNTNTSNLLLQQNELKNMQMDFNVLLARDPGIEFTTLDSIDADTMMQMPAVENSLETKNYSLLAARENITLSQLRYRQIGGQKYPLLVFNSSYAYNRQSSQAGLALLNQSNGLNFGFVASMPLFRSYSIRNQMKVAGVNINTSTLQYNQLKNSVDANYRQAYNNYQTYITVANTENANAKLAYDNYVIAQGRLQQGLSTLLEVKDADRNYQDAQTRYINALYNLKVSEINLKQLIGQLK